MGRSAVRLLFRHFHRVLDSFEGGKLHIVKLAVLFLDLMNVNVLDDADGFHLSRFESPSVRSMPLRWAR